MNKDDAVLVYMGIERIMCYETEPISKELPDILMPKSGALVGQIERRTHAQKYHEACAVLALRDRRPVERRTDGTGRFSMTLGEWEAMYGCAAVEEKV